MGRLLPRRLHCGHVRRRFINVHNRAFVILIVSESIPCLCAAHADLQHVDNDHYDLLS